jgi:hypothetical protein
LEVADFDGWHKFHCLCGGLAPARTGRELLFLRQHK